MSKNNKTISLFRNNFKRKEIALTFDSGIENGYFKEILHVLNKYKIRCTFFITGIWAESNGECGNLIVNEGHLIGNHSYDHSDYSKLGKEDIIHNIKKAEDAIFSNININHCSFFRPPYGSYNDLVLDALIECNYLYNVMWSIDPIDWSESTTEERIFNVVVKRALKGEIILLHLNNINTIYAIERIIPELLKKGYRFVTVMELFNLF